MHVRSGLRAGIGIGGFAAALVAFATVAAAEPPPQKVWELGMGVYGWVPAADLEAGGNNRFTGEPMSRDYNKDLGDAFGDWDGGGGGYVDFRYERFVALIDGAWVQNDYNSDGYQTSTIVDAKVGFRVLDIERPFTQVTGSEAPRFHLDLLAGVRYHESRADVNDTPGDALDYDQVRDWFDPVVGMRVGVELIPNLTLGTVADIGGFDIGSASHVTWSVNPRLTYSAWDHLDLFVGWKHLRDEHDNDREVGLSGPQAGIGYRF